MLEPPPIPDSLLLSRVREAYGLAPSHLTFLPLGADAHTAVYRLETSAGAYFLKLRLSSFDETLVAVPHFLHGLGVAAVIPPLTARSGQLAVPLDPARQSDALLGGARLILYPFIEGQDGYQQALTPAQWTAYGAALHQIHAAQPPPDLLRLLQRETFPPRGRATVRHFLELSASASFPDQPAALMAGLFRSQRPEIERLVRRAEQLAASLQARPLEYVLCHTDLHPGNLLLAAGASLYIVDWDAPLLAPREHDLVFVDPLGSRDPAVAQAAAHFFQGYGSFAADRHALAYYRYERIIQDLAEFGQLLLLSDSGGADRQQSYEYTSSIFLPGGEFDVACLTDPSPMD